MSDFTRKIVMFAIAMVAVLLAKRAGIDTHWDWDFHPWDFKVMLVLVGLYILYQCWWWWKHPK